MPVTAIDLPPNTMVRLYQLAALCRVSKDQVLAWLIDQVEACDLPVQWLGQGCSEHEPAWEYRREQVSRALYDAEHLVVDSE